MTTLKLSNEEAAISGFTHKAVISYTDLTALGAVASGAVAILPYTAGTLIRAAAFKLATAFDGGATSALTIDVGHNGATTDDDDSLINGIEVHADATEILYQDGNGAAFATLRTGYAALDAGNIEATFAATGGNLNVLTTGEIHIYLGVVDLTKI
jgi:hypothetical protein